MDKGRLFVQFRGGLRQRLHLPALSAAAAQWSKYPLLGVQRFCFQPQMLVFKTDCRNLSTGRREESLPSPVMLESLPASASLTPPPPIQSMYLGANLAPHLQHQPQSPQLLLVKPPKP